MDLIAPAVLEPILEVKNKTSNFKESYLKIGEVLIALSICSTTNPVVKKALDNLDAHVIHLSNNSGGASVPRKRKKKRWS